MAQLYPSARPSSTTSELSTPSIVNGTSAAYHSALPSFSGFPGLSSLIQSMASQATTAAQTPTVQTPSQSLYPPQLGRPQSSGNSDLDRLERLKKEILEGQNPIYKAVPQPDFLESLYLGRSLQRSDTVPAHPEQIDSAQGQLTNTQVPPGDDQGGVNAGQANGKNITSNPFQQKGPTLLPSELLNLSRSNGLGFGQTLSLSQNIPEARSDEEPSIYSTNSVQDLPPGLSSSGSSDFVKREHTASDHLLTRPDAEVADGLTRFPLSSHDLLTKDPPYDPKESLRRRDDDAFSVKDRSRRPNLHDARAYDSHYVRDDETEKDHERNFDRRYDYRYDDRRDSTDDYRDRRNISITETRDLRRQDNRQSVAESDTRRLQSSGNGSPTKSMNGNEQARLDSSAISASQDNAKGSAADDHRPSAFEIHAYPRDSFEDGPRTTEERNRPLSIDTRGREYSGRSLYQSQASEDNVPSDISRGLEDRIGGRTTAPLEKRIGVRIPLEDRISSLPVEKAKAPLHERIGDRVQEDRLHRDADSRSTIPWSAPDLPPHVERTAYAGGLMRNGERIGRDLDESSTQVESSSKPHLSSTRDILPASDCEHSRARSPRRGEYHADSPPKRRHPEDSSTNDPKRTDVVKGHYERPTIALERERYPPDDRSAPSLENREWRERSGFAPPSRKPESFPPRDDCYYDGRDWIPNDGTTRVTAVAPEFGREVYKDRHPSVAPRSWDRVDDIHARPRPEVFPTEDRIDDRYPHVDYRDGLRVRPRSPTPPLDPLADLRPVKRAREGSSYYDDRHGYPYAPVYTSRGMTPPPSSTSAYYDTRSAYLPRDARDIYDEQDRGDLNYYDRRLVDLGHPRSPPYSGRAIYSRPDLDRERYGMPPPRTV